MKKNLLLCMMLSIIPILINTGDDWDLISDLDHILAEEQNIIEQGLAKKDRTAAYKSVLQAAKSLSFTSSNVLSYLKPLQENQISTVLNVWIKQAVAAQAENKIKFPQIQGVCNTVTAQYQSQGLYLIGSVPMSNNYIIAGSSVPSSLQFKFFDKTKAEAVSKKPRGAFGEYYWDDTVKGEINRKVADEFGKALKGLFDPANIRKHDEKLRKKYGDNY